MGKFFKYLFCGLFIGAIIAVALYVLGFVIELGNCACGILTCDCDRGDALPFMWSWNSFWTCLAWTTIGGTVIGGIYGASVGIQEKNVRDAAMNAEALEKAKKQREHNAATLKNEVNAKHTTIHSYQKEAYGYSIPSSYSATELQKKGWMKLSNALDSNLEMQEIIEDIEEDKNDGGM